MKVPVTNLAGKTSLQELISIIAGAHLLVGNETGAVHIAAAVSTSAICILGGGHFGRFLPYNLERPSDKPLPVAVFHKMDCFECNWECKYDVVDGNAVACISNIPIKTVWNEVLELFNKQFS